MPSARVLFPFCEIDSAFQLLGSGKLIGKIVISNSDDQSFIAPINVRLAKKQLQVNKLVSYLIVGRLCSSLFVYLASLGVENLVFLSRGGFDDEKSQRILKGIQNQRAEVELVMGDVTVLEDIQCMFKSAKLPIG
ncbi:hypothetical protein BJ875DRAFT_485018 [Amylocarpus encephaloides]|uniref:Ketoreductase (KR) domain-containing protein n=1 Tax=Amylocarpus encephaloides TaxID=45428 RepID=A0A9P7YHJ1_9HELO|nr:hypothetical protein BJ875DRAFT_485018 [Amylocarpus encephaloides]